MASIPHEEAQRKVAALKRLSDAPWQAWRLQDDAELPTHQDLAAAVAAGAVQQAQQHQQGRKLLLHLLAALSHGMAELGKLRLGLGNLHHHKEPLALLRRLWQDLASGWGSCATAAAECGLSEAQKQQALTQLSVMTTKAGLFTATSSSCSALAAVINAHAAATQAQQRPDQQPDQQQQRQSLDELEGSGVVALAATLLLSTTSIGTAWPDGSGMLSSALAPAVPALVELAVAVINSPAAACSFKPPAILQLSRVEVSNPLQAAVVFTWCFANSHAVCLARNKEKQLLLEQLEGSAAVGELLLLALGLTAHLQHEQQQGLSPAPAAQPLRQDVQGTAQQRQQLVVPPYHQQLLKVLGLPGRVSGVAQAAWTRCPPITVKDALWDVMGAALLRPDLALLPIRRDRTSSSSSSQQAQQPGQQAATGTGVSAFVPVLLVAVEAMTLQPDADQWLAASENLAAFMQPALDRRLQHQLAKHLLPAVLRQLLPAAKHAAAQRSQPGQASEQEKLQLLQIDLPAVVDWLTLHAVRTPKGTAAAAAAFAQHTEEYSALLQAALRHSMQHSNRPCLAGQIAAVYLLLHSTADSTLLEAVSAGRQLPLLLVSLIKALASLVGMPGGEANSGTDSSSTTSPVQQDDMLGCAQSVMSKLAGCLSAARQAASTSSSTTSSSSSERQLLAVLLARCLVAIRMLLQAQMEQAALLLAASMQKQWYAVSCCWTALGAGDSAVDLLVEELQLLAAAHPVQLPSSALQQLADEHVQPFKAAMYDLKGVLGAIAAAGVQAAVARDFLRSPAAASAAQQLEAFGAAVAGLLPLPNCCNYHACSSASRVSEGELVSGNSCVCGGCGVARYCSRECQVAHYKGWHKAVCKRLQQQQ